MGDAGNTIDCGLDRMLDEVRMQAIIEPTGVRIVTPTTVELKPAKNYTVHLELAGYKPQNAYVCRVLSPAVHGNLLLGGIPGIAADFEDGAAFELTPIDRCRVGA